MSEAANLISTLVMTVTSVGHITNSTKVADVTYLVIEGTANNVPCKAVLRNELIDELTTVVVPAPGDTLKFTGVLKRNEIQAQTVEQSNDPETALQPKAERPATPVSAEPARKRFIPPSVLKQINAARAAKKAA